MAEMYVIQLLKQLDTSLKDAARVKYLNENSIVSMRAAYESISAWIKQGGVVSNKQIRFILDMVLNLRTLRYFYDNPKSQKTDEECFVTKLDPQIMDHELFPMRKNNTRVTRTL